MTVSELAKHFLDRTSITEDDEGVHLATVGGEPVDWDYCGHTIATRLSRNLYMGYEVHREPDEGWIARLRALETLMLGGSTLMLERRGASNEGVSRLLWHGMAVPPDYRVVVHYEFIFPAHAVASDASGWRFRTLYTTHRS